MSGKITIHCDFLVTEQDAIQINEAGSLIRALIKQGYTSGEILLRDKTIQARWSYEPEPTLQIGGLKRSDLELVAKAPPPDDPPLTVGDRCFLNSGSPELTVVDIQDHDVVVAWKHDDGRVEEKQFSRESVRRSTID